MTAQPPSQSDAARTDGDPGPIRSMHDVFSNWDRCAILYYLQHHDGPVDVDDLTAQLVAWGSGRADDGPREESVVEAVKPHLVHAHVAHLDAFGIVRYDPRAETLVLADDAEVCVSPPRTDGRADSDVLRRASIPRSLAPDQP